MKIVETPDMWVLSAARRLTIPEVRTAAAALTAAIDAEIERKGLKVAGPWVFVSHGLPRDGKTAFPCRFCRPVEPGAAYDGPFELVHLEPIMAASTLHQGPLRTLFTQGYAPLVQAIEKSRHAFSGESREVYHDWNGGKARYHRIEIQFGLKY